MLLAEQSAKRGKTNRLPFSKALRIRCASSLRQSGVGSASSDYPGLRPGLFSIVPHKARHSHSRREDRHCARTPNRGPWQMAVFRLRGVSGTLRQIGIEKANSQKLGARSWEVVRPMPLRERMRPGRRRLRSASDCGDRRLLQAQMKPFRRQSVFPIEWTACHRSNES